MSASSTPGTSSRTWVTRRCAGSGSRVSSRRYGDTMSDADEHEQFEPLEAVPVPVSIEAHDPEVGGPSVVRLFFRAGAYSDWPGGRLSDVLVIEAGDRVLGYCGGKSMERPRMERCTGSRSRWAAG